MKNGQSAAVVSIPVHQAKELLEMYRNIEAADAHFYTCQSQQFRDYVQGVYKAANVKNAYEKLGELVDEKTKS